jgi:hypothetical protein
MHTKKISPFTSALLLGVLAIGCDEDKRPVEQAREADERQAEQNRQIAHQNHELAEATNRLRRTNFCAPTGDREEVAVPRQ